MKKNLLLIFLIPVFVFGQEPEALIHNQKYYVDDYASVFTQEQVIVLDNTIRKFFDTAQISIVTINSFGTITPSEYAVRLGRKWGVGGASNNGLLIVIGIKDRHIEVATGYGLEGDLPDVTVVELQHEHAVPNFKQGKYYEGTKELLDAYINQLSPSAKALGLKEEAAQKIKDAEAAEKVKQVLFIILIILSVGALIFIPIYRKRRKRWLEAERIAEEKRKKEYQEMLKTMTFSGILTGSMASNVKKPEPKKESDDYQYTPPSYSSKSDDDNSSSSSSSSSSGSDYGGGSFGGGGGGSNW